jgi:hypothetical protein
MRARGKRRKCPSLVIFNCIKKRQKTRAPSFQTFVVPSNIDRATAFSLGLEEQTLCLEQLYSYLFQPLYTCTRTNLQVTYSGQIRRWLPVKNLGQKFGAKSGTKTLDRRTNRRTDRTRYRVALQLKITQYLGHLHIVRFDILHKYDICKLHSI